MSADPDLDHLPDKMPDLIYGLRRWPEYESHMSRIRTAQATSGPSSESMTDDPFGPVPYVSPDEPLLFPFLILEAKREMDAPGFLDIGIQAALPLKRLLLLQHRLSVAAPTVESSILKPLVWFWATRGDAVRLYAAHVADDMDEIVRRSSRNLATC